MSRSAFIACVLFCTPPLLASQPGEDLRAAARQGDLAAARARIAAGVPVDAADRWGTTPLMFAANGGHLDMVRLLLEKGADPALRESFFDTGPLSRALAAGHESIAVELLRAGAPGRAAALDLAFSRKRPALARAAMASGPILETERARLAAAHPELDGELRQIFDRLETRPDPPPPVYTAEELAAFAGRFEGWDTVGEIVVEVGDKTLLVAVAGNAAQRLVPRGEKVFASGDSPAAGWEAAFFGRAGLVEGLRLLRPGEAPLTLRRSVAEPLADASRRQPAAAERAAPVTPTTQWPGFRGANGSGIGDGKDTPVDWDLRSGTGVRFAVELPGLANSSPVVWDDNVFVTTAVATGGSEPLRTGLTGSGTEVEESVEHRWLVLAYDKRSGEKAWETEVGRGVPLTRRHFKATQANSSPATDGKHLVVVFPTAGLACLGLDGAIHWKHELGGLNAGGFNDPSLEWGYASSPVILEDRVILQVDIHDGPYLAAWDLASGRQLWRTERPGVDPSWSTPAVWRTPGGIEIVTNSSTIYGYDPGDGRELWSLGPSSVQVVSMPVVGNGVVYVGAGYPPIKAIYAVRAGIRSAHLVEAGKEHPALLWSHGRGGAYMPTPLLYRGLFYVVHHNGRVVAYDAATGDSIYKARFSRGGTFTNSPVAVNGRIYTGTEEGLLYVVAAGPEYRELAVHDFDEPLMATPAVSDGTLFVRTPSRLWALAEND